MLLGEPWRRSGVRRLRRLREASRSQTAGCAPCSSSPRPRSQSRGQQRTAALALRLAEARLLHDRTVERPLLLLDDVLSELDESRRHAVLAAIEADQVLITSPDPDRCPPSYTASAQLFEITAGVAQRV